MIHAGVVLIHFDKPVSEKQMDKIQGKFDIDSLKCCIKNPQQLYKLDLIARLEKLRAVLPTCIVQSNSQCFIDIYVLYIGPNEALARDGQYFLELMLMVNRSFDPITEFLPAFDIPSTSSLLNIFVNLPSPHIDHRLSDWCENPDILGFLTEDIQVRIPGMKSTLYIYQKVGGGGLALEMFCMLTKPVLLAFSMENTSKRTSTINH